MSTAVCSKKSKTPMRNTACNTWKSTDMSMKNECKQRNYNTMKNKKNTPDKLELNKYCPFCKKHTLHSETK